MTAGAGYDGAMPSGLTDALIANLTPRLTGTAYEIARVEGGFDVRLDLADARWWMPLSRNGLTSTFTYQVRVDDAARRYSINDLAQEIAWKAGTDGAARIPTLRAGVSRFSGTRVSLRRDVVVGVSDAGRVEPVVDIAFNSEHVRSQIAAAAAELGITPRMSRSTRIGLAFGIGGLAFALIVGGAVVVSALLL